MPKNIKHIKMIFGDKKEANRLFQQLAFFNVLVEKSRVKRV